MGTAHSREGELEDSESEDESVASEASGYHSADGEKEEPRRPVRKSPGAAGTSKGKADVLSYKLGNLSLSPGVPPTHKRAKLYLHTGGNTAKSRWTVYGKEVSYEFVKEQEDEDDEDDDREWISQRTGKATWVDWYLRVADRVSAKIDDALQMQFFDDQLRVDFVSRGVWAMKFANKTDYEEFVHEFQNSKFENNYQMKATEENKTKVFGKDFMTWATGEDADESVWEDAEDSLEEQKVASRKLKETYNEALEGGAKSLTMGAGEHSFLIGNSGIDVFRNMATGVHGKGVSIRLQGGTPGDPFSTPKKGMLIRGESNMMLLSPAKDAKQHPTGVSQLDLATGKVVSEWKFEKDGAPISMRDLTNDSKGSQLDMNNTFLGLDDNRLCRWDMRVQTGIVQQLSSPILSWNEGHQFARGTNFQCFASTGDGAVVVGSRDGKVRLYGTTSMRMAKTAFPGLGSPITHVDVTYDGKWILATTDTYMILISTLFKDKDGKTKTGFTGRMGSRIAAPRLLKLNPVDAHAAGVHKFIGGQFSWVTESGKQERHLVVSVGNFSVVWDFMRVKQSDHECYRHERGLKSCYCYEVVPKDESIVESRFMNDTFHSIASPEAPLVVATPKKVTSYNI
ncbi:hypothetical protein MPTK1_1g20970 [Marchantia polymorpha subsp. ruderalis]|uniref:Uncharacterized protein n=2 Tax=Marchantia polymorpha TaxID=3197 RepID=A0A176WQE4_MARPO|nr:hypothetical protein AXG93_3253s1090 [Marchantia polymorpha subsp. ruderalis]PTQ50473.1 hypothetical protein MARPO_0001s0432 [Marchantia polymorpha]BBM99391.1 hypothetical protein Mp_1g20970 [Marchantia polymorpha subsp. ruderalis]|eukprot:PTQ50473.1 hypothetical protein MARPO_0001s0432 [Marchantia polymorpha]